MAINFSKEQLQENNSNWAAWWDHQLDRPMVIIEDFAATKRLMEIMERRPGCGCPAHFSLSTPADEVIDFFEAQIESFTYYADARPKWFVNFGPGIIAGFLGAKVKVRPDTVWFEPPEDFSLEKFQPYLNRENIWYKRVNELTEAALKRWKNNISISISDIGENFDILSAFRTTEKLLMDLHDRPGIVESYLMKLTEIWLEVYEEFSSKILLEQQGTCSWAPMWAPGRMYILQSDFSFMISTKMFERFVLPDLIRCCDYLDYSFYHLDGKGQIPHLDVLLQIQNLHGIQWIPGEGSGSAENYIDLLKKIIDAKKLCQVYVTPEGALKIKDRLGGKGFAFHIVHNGMNEDSAQALIKQLYS